MAMLSRGSRLSYTASAALLFLHHLHRGGDSALAIADSSGILLRGGSNYGVDDSGGSTGSSGGGGSVKLRTTNSYRVFQLRAASMIRNRAIETSGDSGGSNNVTSLSQEEDKYDNITGSSGSGNDATLTQHSTSTIISTDITLLPSCPPPYDPNRVDYAANDTVEVYNTIFTCQPNPYEVFCNIDTLEEAERTIANGGDRDGSSSTNADIQMLWLQAWKEIGQCSPLTSSSSETPTSIVPTSTPKPTSRIPSQRPITTQPPLMNTTSTTFTNNSKPDSTMKPTRRIPTYYPTYHPTYSPTTDWPTYFPAATPSGMPTSFPSWMPSTSVSPTNFPTLAPTRSPLAMSPSAYNIMDEDDESLICKSTQIHLRLEISTDNYPQDTAWQFIERTANVILLSSPINGYSGTIIGNGMMEVQTDIRDICLNGTISTTNAAITSPRGGTTRRKKYELIVKDKYGDGLCCRPGIEEGYYKLMQKRKDSIDNRWKWSVIVAGSNFRSKEVHHHFDLLFHEVGTTESADIVQASLGHDEEKDNSTKSNTVAASFELLCPPPQRKITVQIQTDAFGADTSWDFRMKNGPILAKNEAKYHENHIEVDERDICIHDSSLYELTVYDDFGDGMCCAYKRGHYKILTHHPMSPTGLQTETVLFGGFFISNQVTHLINTTLPELSDRDLDWLNSHNKRRLYWHHYYNTSYVPLQWSDALEADAKAWADILLDSCKEGMYHDPQKTYGENAAANSGSGSWGTKREADMIVARFIDREVDDPWPANGHLTQALWRASNYVGCADSHRFLGGRKHCHTQVCRYARIGNCDMGSHLNEDGTIDWKTPMLEDVNYCGPICPADGCKA